MTTLSELLSHDRMLPPLPAVERTALAIGLEPLTGASVYSRSLAVGFGGIFFLCRIGPDKFLGILTHEGSDLLTRFIGDDRSVLLEGQRLSVKLCSLNRANALALRSLFPFTCPRVIGVRKSVGCGDRLGLATPGHVRALRAIWLRGTHIAPIFAQQSIREMTRTGRTPEQVLDDATWGVFQEGWRDGFGSDADHLKTEEDIDRCVNAGFTLYTIDPGDHVDNQAHAAPLSALRSAVEALPWKMLKSSSSSLCDAYLDKRFDLGDGIVIAFTEEIGKRVKEGDHGSTFGGNPLAMAAAIGGIEALLYDGVVEKALEAGGKLRRMLEEVAEEHGRMVRGVRGIGLMSGLELRFNPTPVLKALQDHGVLALKAGLTVLRLLPPYLISDEDLELLQSSLHRALGSQL